MQERHLLLKMFTKRISRGDGSLLNSLHWVSNNSRHKASVMFVSNDRKHIWAVCNGEVNIHKQTRLSNKNTQTNEKVEDIFQDKVEVELQKNQCKVFSLILRVHQIETKIDSPLLEENLTTWKVSYGVLLDMLLSNACAAILDGSFFLNNLEYISAS